MAVSPDSMIASAPSKIAFATSEASARVGRGESIIDSSIWVATMVGTPRSSARRTSCFWRIGTSSYGQLHAEVAARDHHRVGHLADGVEVVDRGTRLDLGDDRRAVRAEQRSELGDVGGATHEGLRDVVGAELEWRAGCRRGPGR